MRCACDRAAGCSDVSAAGLHAEEEEDEDGETLRDGTERLKSERRREKSPISPAVLLADDHVHLPGGVF